MDLERFCARHLRVQGSFEETDEMIKHSEEFKQEAVRIVLTSGLPRGRVASDWRRNRLPVLMVDGRDAPTNRHGRYPCFCLDVRE